MEGAIYKVNPLVAEDDSDYVDNWEQDINPEDHSKFLPRKRKLLRSFIFQPFLGKK